MKNNWKDLTSIQIGKYAEYYAKMAFTACGFYVFSSEVDDHGIDFVVRPKCRKEYYEIQVKSVRGFNYTYITKEKMSLDKGKYTLPDNRLVCYLRFEECGEPEMYLIPAKAWEKPNDVFKDKEYEGLKSKPEWGINISRKNLPMIQQYRFEQMIERLKEGKVYCLSEADAKP